jgi:hypothetical protein
LIYKEVVDVWIVGWDKKEVLVNLDNIVDIKVEQSERNEKEWKVVGRAIASEGYEGAFGMETIIIFRGEEKECRAFFEVLKSFLDSVELVKKV